MQGNLTRVKAVQNLSDFRDKQHLDSTYTRKNGRKPPSSVHNIPYGNEQELSFLDGVIDFSGRYLYEIEDRNYPNWITELRSKSVSSRRESPPVKELHQCYGQVQRKECCSIKEKALPEITGISLDSSTVPVRRLLHTMSNEDVPNDDEHGEHDYAVCHRRRQSRSTGTDTKELDLMQQMSIRKLRHKTQILKYRAEIAEAQAMIFHLSEQLYKSQEGKKIPTKETVEELRKTSSPTETPEVQLHENDATGPPKTTEDDSRMIADHQPPATPHSLNAVRLTLDNRWLVTWAGPPLNKLGMNQGRKICGYQVEFNGAEVKRIDSPFVTKCILQLGTLSNKTHRGRVGVKTVAAGQKFSESAQLDLWDTGTTSSTNEPS
ncbi:hypothetical protein CRM22_006096 [Opisthorchis felineus]|uniref:RIMS-binding protein 1/2/3 Fn3 domain-containing protein n=1 Tax=Opisthorchis felineus TaxID=147828 RepID=A0A4S2LU11_OPIFE|nr:hypothetical protein CRM22_006096 [Opisthorchis felineus]TGZ65010.1 hypothetical protein CRM22_006096 [Opisthorchis felineus]